MSIDQVINLLAIVTLVEMMFSIGLGVMLADVAAVAKGWGLLGRAALANYVLVPAAAVGLLLLFRANPLVAAGFLVIAVCPGAPYGPPFTAMAKGNVVMAVGLMVILAGSSAVVAPLLLKMLLPVVAGDAPIKINLAKMVTTLIVGQILPLFAGLYLRQRNPALAGRIKKPCNVASTLLNLVLLGAILAAQYELLASIRPRGYIGMLALLITAAAAGWLMGGSDSRSRKTLTFTTSVRNVGVGLVIVTGSFPGTAAVTAATAYGLFQTLVMAAVAFGWGRRRSA